MSNHEITISVHIPDTLDDILEAIRQAKVEQGGECDAEPEPETEPEELFETERDQLLHLATELAERDAELLRGVWNELGVAKMSDLPDDKVMSAVLLIKNQLWDNK